MALLKTIFQRMFAGAEAANLANLLRLCRDSQIGSGERTMLDVGCDNGEWTTKLAKAAGATRVEGVEVVAAAAAAAQQRGVSVHGFDLNQPWPLRDNTYDLVHSNQVIEHVNDVDMFVAEIHRILKPGGVAVISTENGSSWHNIFAAILGWQIFSLTNVSGKVAGLGNPIAIQRNAPPFPPTWRHKIIMNFLGLKELLQVNGFVEVKITGAGYYPLPAFVGRIDDRHSVYITVTGRKPRQ